MKLRSVYYSVEFLQMKNVFDEVAGLLREDKRNPVLNIIYKVSDSSERKFIENMVEENSLNLLVIDTGIMIENKNNLRR